ncbi:putative DNA helicase [Achromobacter phage vB_AxyP_19-32_Axy22]|uniref:Putative DNA helicase n=1 Tax=Achromobacter phage vB_AxyP_19-32_Axy22 TaxID=2591046 RepID=A0A514CVX1_9CAUD|nr:putative DNA helicase [Achromobacter phage vB_AxyP_19-32_Axy22]
MEQTTPAMPLNADQLAAAEGFFESLFRPEEKEINITGPGGVGKTFTMAYMIDFIMPRYFQTCELMGIKPEYDEVVMTATTNKAAEVLAAATGRETVTIHSHLGLTIKNNFKTGEVDLIKGRSWKVHERQIVFIDEGSMIDHKLRTLIKEGLLNCKIVYVSDHCQLPPVMEEISPIYTQGFPRYHLSIPMRTNVPELLELNTHFRDIVEGNKDWGDIKVTPGIVDHIPGGSQGGLEIQKLIREYFVDRAGEARMLAYTNRRVLDYNTFIRSERGIHGEFEEGEELVSNSAVQLSTTQRLSIEQEVTIKERGNIIHQIPIEGDVYLECRSCTLDLGYGGTIEHIMVPCDYDHFHALVKHYAQTKNWQMHFALKEKYPDLRSKDASTVHKSQGSSFDVAFLDLTDLSTCRNPKVAARMFYVAVSRARKRVIMYGELAEKYGRIVV